MTINFSRHARRRAKLYNISESKIEEILRDLDLQDGERDLIIEVPEFKYPIKIVVSIERNVVTVITTYPLKKGRSQ